MSQQDVADKLSAAIYRATGREDNILAKAVSDYERGWYTWPRGDVRAAFCQVFDVATPEELGFYRPPRIRQAPAALEPVELTVLGDRGASSDANRRLKVPAGRAYLGAELVAHYTEADRVGGDVLLVEPTDEMIAALSCPDRRSFVVAVDEEQRRYLADGRQLAGRASRRTGLQAVPLANLVDDLTVGIVWAATNADSALSADDAQLARSQAYVERLEVRPASRGEVDELPVLNPPAGHWLGSIFCSRHILRHLDQLTGEPLFWTREQRGEEASAWLLWSHKFEYLRRTSRRYSALRRGFCIPEPEVRASPPYERVMLLLSMALMEAFGVRVEVITEPDYATVEGFVLGERAIVANWLGSPGLWCVEASASEARLRTYREVAGQVAAESLTMQETSLARLEALASYLDVPWGWFRRRCTELAASGIESLVQPRSRLLSTRGLDTAIRYVAYIDVLEGDDFARD